MSGASLLPLFSSPSLSLQPALCMKYAEQTDARLNSPEPRCCGYNKRPRGRPKQGRKVRKCRMEGIWDQEVSHLKGSFLCCSQVNEWALNGQLGIRSDQAQSQRLSWEEVKRRREVWRGHRICVWKRRATKRQRGGYIPKDTAISLHGLELALTHRVMRQLDFRLWLRVTHWS